jgi:hypothetical protein
LSGLVRVPFSIRRSTPITSVIVVASQRACIRSCSRAHRQIRIVSPRDLVRSSVEEAVEATSARMPPKRRDCAIARLFAHLVQIRRDFHALSVFVDLDLNIHFAQDALEALHEALAIAPLLLQDRIVAGLEALFDEDMFVCAEERAGRGVRGTSTMSRTRSLRTRLRALNYIVEGIDNYSPSLASIHPPHTHVQHTSIRQILSQQLLRASMRIIAIGAHGG